jgi:hypothetical protein
MITCAATLPTITMAGSVMLPVPRTALPSRLEMQITCTNAAKLLPIQSSGPIEAQSI